MDELIARLEAAEAGSCELDVAIYEAIGAVPLESIDPIAGKETFWIFNGSIGFPPKFSQSLDAALTLVPEGWRWLLDKRPNGEERPDGFRCDVYYANEVDYGEARAQASNPALAICIAALKARRASDQKTEKAAS